jgi:type III secretion protein J
MRSSEARALAAVTVAVAVAAAVTGISCTTGVLHGLDEPAANEALAALERAGIGAEKVADEGGQGISFNLRVARGDAALALDALRVHGLPRGRRHGFAEVYGQASLIPTPSEERARYLEALGGEIERTLETAEGVLSARVHLVLEEADPLSPDGKPRTTARAAVLIKAAQGRLPLAEADVKKLVSGSVPGLDPQAVAVVVTAAPRPSEPGSTALASVGPLRVTPSSRPLLLTMLGLGLGLIGLLGTLLLITVRRRQPR